MFWKFFFLVHAIVFGFGNLSMLTQKKDIPIVSLYIMAISIVGYIALKWGL